MLELWSREVVRPALDVRDNSDDNEDKDQATDYQALWTSTWGKRQSSGNKIRLDCGLRLMVGAHETALSKLSETCGGLPSLLRCLAKRGSF
jgi:hypothetical protein